MGVDVEYRREEVEVEELAERFFALEERRAVAAALGDDKRKVFFDIWSAKEACIKAAGAGLGIPLDAFSAASAMGRLRRNRNFFSVRWKRLERTICFSGWRGVRFRSFRRGRFMSGGWG